MNDAGSFIPHTAPGSSLRADAGHLALPFFDERHRALSARLDRWLHEQDAAIEAVLAQPPKTGTRSAVKLLGEGGWFKEALREPIDLRGICLVREALAYRDDLLDFAYSIQLLAALPVVLWGTPGQRARFVPDLVAGRRVGAFALTERASGSDVASVALAAVETAQGYDLNGEKAWIANADIADDIVVLARTGAGAVGLSLFFVARSEGPTSTAVDLMAPRPFGQLTFTDCAVAADRLIGEKGAGLAVALDTLERFRMSVGAAANGFARRALDEARRHATAVRRNGSRLADIGVVQQKLARMAVALHTARLAVWHAAWDMDREGEDRLLMSSLAKLYATEAACITVDSCVQLHGAAGLVGNSVPERLYRQIRSLRIYEGTSEIQESILGEAVAQGFLK